MTYVLVGAGGKIGRLLSCELREKGMKVLEVSSKCTFEDIANSRFSTFDTLCRKNALPLGTKVVYLSYIRNPIQNAILLLKTLWLFKKYCVSGRFYYFSTFSIAPKQPLYDRPWRIPVFCSFPGFYNLNKYFAEIMLYIFATLNREFRDNTVIVRPTILIGIGMGWSNTICSLLSKNLLISPPLDATVPAIAVDNFVSSFIENTATNSSSKICSTHHSMKISELIEFHKQLLLRSNPAFRETEFIIPSIHHYGIHRSLALKNSEESSCFSEVLVYSFKKFYQVLYSKILRNRGVYSLPFEIFYFSKTNAN